MFEGEAAIGKRIKLEGYFGTIKFYGQVPANSGKFWFGIEWDYVSRGKHSGEYEGVKYFSCNVENSGSFVKPNNKIQFGRSFEDALEEKYFKNSMGGALKDVEIVGFDKVTEKQSKAESLAQVGLIDMNISCCMRPAELLTCIISLDLTSNLISSWSVVEQILLKLSSLESLNLSRNKFSDLTLTRNLRFPNLKLLSLNSTGILFENFLYLSNSFPNLIEVHLASNNIIHINPFELTLLSSLKHIDLSRNEIHSWDVVENALGFLPSLEYLSLEGNCITSIEHDPSSFSSLTTINVSENPLNNLSFIDQLNTFRSLADVKAKRLSLFHGISFTETRLQFIARIAKLKRFNNSEITPADRKDVEIYYMNTIFRDIINGTKSKDDILASNPRYYELVDIYEEPVEYKKEEHSIKSSLILIRFLNAENNVLNSKEFPKSATVRMIKMYCQKISKIASSKQRLLAQADINENFYEIELDDDYKDLDFYALVSPTTLIIHKI